MAVTVKLHVGLTCTGYLLDLPKDQSSAPIKSNAYQGDVRRKGDVQTDWVTFGGLQSRMSLGCAEDRCDGTFFRSHEKVVTHYVDQNRRLSWL